MKRISYISIILIILFLGIIGNAQQNRPEESTKTKIGCLFPLSGSKEAFGTEALSGALIAIDAFEPNFANQEIELLIEDTKDDAQVTKYKVKRLVERGASSIFGTLTKPEAAAAADAAQKLGIPIILMNRGAEFTNSGEFVFHNSTDPDSEIKKLLDFARINAGINCFSCLSPDNPYGNEYSKAFEMQLETLGLKAPCRVYSNDSVDFKGHILALKASLGGEPNSCAIFIPDFPKRLKILLPQIFFWELDKVKFLGTEGWCNRELHEDIPLYVKNALFTCPFWLDDPRVEVQNFTNKFEKFFGRKPTLLAAFAYDNAKILAQCASKNPAPQAIRSCLASLTKFHGVCGLTSFSPNRRAVRNLQIFRFDGLGNIVIVQ